MGYHFVLFLSLQWSSKVEVCLKFCNFKTSCLHVSYIYSPDVLSSYKMFTYNVQFGSQKETYFVSARERYGHTLDWLLLKFICFLDAIHLILLQLVNVMQYDCV